MLNWVISNTHLNNFYSIDNQTTIYFAFIIHNNLFDNLQISNNYINYRNSRHTDGGKFQINRRIVSKTKMNQNNSCKKFVLVSMQKFVNLI